jgi:hypothetical protein
MLTPIFDRKDPWKYIIRLPMPRSIALRRLPYIGSSSLSMSNRRLGLSSSDEPPWTWPGTFRVAAASPFEPSCWACKIFGPADFRDLTCVQESTVSRMSREVLEALGFSVVASWTALRHAESSCAKNGVPGGFQLPVLSCNVQ